MKRLLKVFTAVVLLSLFSITSAIAAQVMTVLGPIDSNKLGVTLMHEHVTFAYPGWYADESAVPYDREAIEAKCLPLLMQIKALGVQTFVDATPADTGGRDPILMKNLAMKSGVNIVAATGLYFEKGGAPAYFLFNKRIGRDLEQDLYELFMKEITVGIGKSGVKAGIIKVGTDDPKITDYEKTVIKVAVRVSKETGVPIFTHCQGATVGPAQQELFLSLGADPKKIMIGHQNNSVDNKYHLGQLQKPGFFIGFDRTSLGPVAAEDSIISLVKAGYANRIMLSHDYGLQWIGRPFSWPAAYKTWHPTYIHLKLIPKMKAAGVTDEQINTMLIDNPRRFFEGI